MAMVVSAVSVLAACGGGSTGSEVQTTGEAASTAASKIDSTCGIPNFRAEMLAVINAARAAGAVCGTTVMGSVGGKMAWNDQLNNAATVTGLDLAKTGNTSAPGHVTSDGRTPTMRVNAAGYAFRGTAENIGWGYTKASDSLHAVNGWMNSPLHCIALHEYYEL